MYVFDRDGFAERLNKTMEERGYNEFRLQRKCCLDLKTVLNMMIGNTIPRLENFAAVCRELDVSADYLLFGDEE